MKDARLLAPGEEQFEVHVDGKREWCIYDFKDSDGTLFNCVKISYVKCKEAKEEWLKGRKRR
jgi:hypothetical protein